MISPALESVFIIIPVHNREVQIRRSIASIQAQTYANWRLLVVDDQSTDNTVDVILQFIADDDRIDYKTNAEYPQGPSGARNSGIDECLNDCEYIAFLDSDDEWTPDYLQNALKQFIATPEAKVVVSDLRRLTEYGKVLVHSKFKKENGVPVGHNFPKHQDFFKLEFGSNSLSDAIENRLTIGLHSAVFRRSVFSKQRLSLDRVAEDHLLTLKLIQNKTPIVYLNKLGLNYYVHNGNISSVNSSTDSDKQYKNSILEIRLLKRFANQNELNKNELEKVYKRLGELYFWYIGYHHFNYISEYKRAYQSYQVGLNYTSSPIEKLKMHFTMIKCQMKIFLEYSNKAHT